MAHINVSSTVAKSGFEHKKVNFYAQNLQKSHL